VFRDGRRSPERPKERKNERVVFVSAIQCIERCSFDRKSRITVVNHKCAKTDTAGIATAIRGRIFAFFRPLDDSIPAPGAHTRRSPALICILHFAHGTAAVAGVRIAVVALLPNITGTIPATCREREADKLSETLHVAAIHEAVSIRIVRSVTLGYFHHEGLKSLAKFTRHDSSVPVDIEERAQSPIRPTRKDISASRIRRNGGNAKKDEWNNEERRSTDVNAAL
jgi:hypothetical protein